MLDGLKKRVLFVDHTASLGGGEIALLNLVTNLHRSRYEPVVLLCSSGPLVKRLEEAGIETHVMPLSGSVVNVRKDSLGVGSLARIPQIWRSVVYAWRMRAFINARQIDLVHTNSLKADLLGGLAARLARVPLIWHVRDRIDADYLPRSVVYVFRRLCRFVPDFVVANSAATLGTVGLDRTERGAAIPSGIDLRARVVHDGMDQSGLDEPVEDEGERPRLVGLVGRISRWKGQHIFLQAAARVHERFPQVRFQIIGAALFDEREYEEEIHELAARLGTDKYVEFTGFREDVPAMIARLEILVHASVTAEPFGQVVTEGMVAAKPVVATAGGGVLEIVVDGVTGLLVPMGDAEAMSIAINQLLEDPAAARRMGEVGRQRVLEQFAIENTVAKIERVYDEVLATRQMMTAGVTTGDRTHRSFAIAIGASGAMVAGAFAVAEGLRWKLGAHAPLTGLFLAAVAISTRLFGAWAGLLTTVASVAAAAYVLPPGNSWMVDKQDMPVLILFATVALIITPMIGSLKRAEARARAAQAVAEQARLESEFIARAAAAFAMCTGKRGLLQAVGRLATSMLCDWCVIDLVEEAGGVVRASANHREPGKYELAQRLSLLRPPGGSENAVAEAIRSQVAGELNVLNDGSEDADAPERRKIMAQLGAGPAIVVPFKAGGRTLGTISMVRCDEKRPYRATDLKLASEFAWRAAIALAGAKREEVVSPTDYEMIAIESSGTNQMVPTPA